MAKTKFGSDAIVEAIHTYAWHDDRIDAGTVIREGTRFAGDDPVVLANPAFYLPAGRPSHEREAALLEAYKADGPPVEPVLFTVIPEALQDEDAVVACRPVIGCPFGKRLPKTDPAVLAQPDHFVPVIGKGRTRENSVIALAGMSHRLGDGSTRTVFEGQYVDVNDAMVRLHPRLFAVPARKLAG